ncbi:MAG: hypothetical protein M0C28_11470 [Candidatus Moduliflexus flocculans]|nr:hypothetical protein [Candidatus Moduliflexus flocculans]
MPRIISRMASAAAMLVACGLAGDRRERAGPRRGRRRPASVWTPDEDVVGRGHLADGDAEGRGEREVEEEDLDVRDLELLRGGAGVLEAPWTGRP